MSVGVNVRVTVCPIPAFGVAAGVAKANVPATDAVPPVSVEAERAWPNVIALAVGAAEIVGVALLTVSVVLLETLA